LMGAVIGAVFQRGAQWLLPSPWSFLATGAGVLIVLLLLPDGLGGLLWRGRDELLRRVARRRGISTLSLDRGAGEDEPLLASAAAAAGDPATGDSAAVATGDLASPAAGDTAPGEPDETESEEVSG